MTQPPSNLRQIDDAAASRQARAKQARNIQRLMRNYRHGKHAPAVWKASGAGALAGSVVWGMTYLVEQPIGIVVGMGAFIAAYRWVYKRCAYQTPAEHVFDQLADYTPHDRDGYATFQAQARQGAVDWDALAAWLVGEVAALDADIANSTEQVRLDKARARFTQRDPAKPKSTEVDQ